MSEIFAKGDKVFLKEKSPVTEIITLLSEDKVYTVGAVQDLPFPNRILDGYVGCVRVEVTGHSQIVFLEGLECPGFSGAWFKKVV